jgi:hypothetical protein
LLGSGRMEWDQQKMGRDSSAVASHKNADAALTGGYEEGASEVKEWGVHIVTK